MKKTISITLGGHVFAIEEDGYNALDTYLNGLKRHFAKDDSADELLTDIETSIGEKFSEKLGPQKQAVTLGDVQEVIRVMGEVNEIAGDDETPSATREAAPEEKTSKHLFRNGDNLVVAGVCSGIAAYFGIDPLIIRLLFIALAFAHGLGFIAYAILWIAVPLAQTNAQKLEMRGKPTTLEEIQEMVKEKTETQPTSGLRRLLNVPVIVIGAIARVLRGIIRVMGPVISIIVGLFIVLGSTLWIAMTNIMAALLLFRVNSPYIASDLPLNELASRPLYYVGVVALYFLVLIPLIFLATLGISFIRRKNSFRAMVGIPLIGIWVLAAAVGAFAATDIGPWAYNRVQELEQQSTTSKQFDVRDFTNITSGESVSLTVKQGDTFSVKFNGLEADIDALSVRNEKGTLVIDEQNNNRRVCMFCFFGHRVEGEVTMPKLTSYSGRDASRVTIDGFSDSLDISVSDIARANVTFLGQDATTTARDSSHISIVGQAKHLVVHTEDIGRVEGQDLTAEHVTLTAQDASHVTLAGIATELIADLKDISHLNAGDLEVNHATVTTADSSHAEVSPRDRLDATSSDMSHIESTREAASSTIKENDFGNVNE